MAKQNVDLLHDFGPAIARLRAIAADAGNRLLLADGPPNPDAPLLELCAEIAEARKTSEAAKKVFYAACGSSSVRDRSAAQQAEFQAMRMNASATGRSFSHKLRAASKIKAVTAAGIYAKAIAVRSSLTGAAGLAMSLADDLVSNPTLRAALWEADPTAIPSEGSGSV